MENRQDKAWLIYSLDHEKIKPEYRKEQIVKSSSYVGRISARRKWFPVLYKLADCLLGNANDTTGKTSTCVASL